MRNTLFIIVALVISGCESSQTSAVKESYIDSNNTMTTSQLLDNRKICKDVNWDSFEDQHKRTVVEYTCTFINTDDFLAKSRDNYVNSRNIAINNHISEMRETIKSQERKINDLTNNREKISEDEVKLLREEPVEIPKYLEQVKRLAEQLDKIKTNYNDKEYMDFLMSDDFQFVVGNFFSSDLQNEMARYFLDSIGPFIAQVTWMRSQKTAIEKEKYKKENVDQYLDGMRNYIGDLNTYLNNIILKENQEIEQRNKDRTSFINAQKTDALHSVDNNIDEYKNSIVKENEDILSAEEELKNLKADSDKKFPKYEKIVEKFQWVVNKDNQAVPSYGELVAVSSDSDSNKVLIKHNDPANSMLIISRNDTENYEEYIQKFATINFLNFLYN